MFLIAITEEEGEIRYWQGGIIFGAFLDEAARFATFADADSTIDLLRQALGADRVPANIRVEAMPEGLG
jgi:hypothetical protein